MALRSVRGPIISAVTLKAVTIVIELALPIKIATMYKIAFEVPPYSVTAAEIIPINVPKK